MLVATSSHGIGLTADSASYVSAARNLTAGRGLTMFTGEPLVAWPPLYPLLLSLPVRAGIDLFVFLRWFHALVTGFTAFAMVRLGGRLLRHWLASAGAVLLAAFGTPLLYVGAQAWTEPVFMLLAIALALSLMHFADTGKSRWLVSASCLAVLCVLQRYVGVALVCAASLFLLVGLRGPLRQRIAAALATGLPATIALGAWLARNYWLTSTLTGGRSQAGSALGELLQPAAGYFAYWFVPDLRNGLLLVAVGGIAAGAFVVAGILCARRERLLAAPALFGAAYLVGLVISTAFYASDEVSTRLLAPAYPFVAIVLLAGLDRLARQSRLLLVVAATVTVGWLANIGDYTLTLVRHCVRNGAGIYDGAEWRRSELIPWLRQHPLAGTIRSNDPAAVYLLLGRDAMTSPRRTGNARQVEASLAVLPGDYLVWFDQLNKPFLYSVPELARRYGLRELAFVGDGGVLVFDPGRRGTGTP